MTFKWWHACAALMALAHLPLVLLCIWEPRLGVPLFLITGTWWLLSLRRQRAAYLRHERWYRGRCVACGYDLRSGPDRCPECGASAKG